MSPRIEISIDSVGSFFPRPKLSPFIGYLDFGVNGSRCTEGGMDGLGHIEFLKSISWYVVDLAYDPFNLILYVSMHQIFRIWAIPFFSAPVSLTTVLRLVKIPPSKTSFSPAKYYIQSQNDLYQVNEFVRFVSQFGILSVAVLVWQFVATGMCVLGALVFWPVSWVEQNVVGGNAERGLAEVVDG